MKSLRRIIAVACLSLVAFAPRGQSAELTTGLSDPSPAVAQAAPPTVPAAKPKPKVGATAIIKAPAQVAPGDLVILDASESEAKSFAWTVLPESAAGKFLAIDKGTKAVFASGQPGQYTFVLATAAGDNVAVALVTVTVGTPTPGPTPPGPGPVPVPVPSGPFRVMMIEETADRTALPREQMAALTSLAAREYLGRKTAKDADGKTPGYRLWDDDFDDEQTANSGEPWPTLYKRAKADSQGALPWLLMSSDNRVESRPFPKTEAELLDALKKFGGE